MLSHKRIFSPTLLLGLTATICILVFLFLRTAPFQSAVIVNSLADNTTVNGQCTLREAIDTVNGAGNGDCPGITTEIRFNISGTISLNTPLPTLTASNIVLSGDTDANGLPNIALNGTLLGAGSGLQITGSNNTVNGLTIINFPDNGIVITGAGAQNNVIGGCYIGVNEAFDLGVGNGANGILIADGASGSLIGGDRTTTTFNIIGQNGQNGVELRGNGTGNPATETRNNTLIGNSIGVDVNGTLAQSNNDHGVLITNGAQNNVIGGAEFNSNVISSNVDQGIAITGALTSGNQVINNYVGTDFSGGLPLPNNNGILITDGANNNIIQTTNTISHNTNAGILINAGANANTISGNNTIQQNGTYGVAIRDLTTVNNQIEQNSIRSNSQSGILITDGTNNNSITENTIEQNTTHGVEIADATNDNRINQNTITQNTQNGITVTGTNVGNRFRQNSIFNNGGLGIDLGNDGVTPNDPGDSDTGPNNFQNYPQNLLAIYTDTDTIVGGTIDAGANSPVRIEVFSNTAGDEGEIFRGAITDVANGAFTFGLPLGIQPQTLTLTSEGADSSTSEFSAPVSIVPLIADFIPNPNNGILPLTLNFTDTTVGAPTSYFWDFGDGLGTSVQQNPTYIYNTPGVYTVTLTVFLTNGIVTLSDTATATITVIAPTATPTNTLIPETAYIVKSSQPPFAAPGDTISYLIDVINPTIGTFTNVTVLDTMPDVVEVISVSSTSGSVSFDGQIITFGQTTLSPNDHVVITVTGRLRADPTVPHVVNRACLTSTQNPTPSCASAGFIRALALPNTGESPRNTRIVAGIIFVGVLGALAYGVRAHRRRLTTAHKLDK